MTNFFKKKHTLAERQAESKKICSKYKKKNLGFNIKYNFAKTYPKKYIRKKDNQFV